MLLFRVVRNLYQTHLFSINYFIKYYINDQKFQIRYWSHRKFKLFRKEAIVNTCKFLFVIKAKTQCLANNLKKDEICSFLHFHFLQNTYLTGNLLIRANSLRGGGGVSMEMYHVSVDVDLRNSRTFIMSKHLIIHQYSCLSIRGLNVNAGDLFHPQN